MPSNTVKVDRSTRWGNPFVIGEHGTQEVCVALFNKLMHGGLPKAEQTPERMAYRRMVLEQVGELRGCNLACWCNEDSPCHADTLLQLANA